MAVCGAIGGRFRGRRFFGLRRILGGWAALGVVSLWSGIVASASEVVDVSG